MADDNAPMTSTRPYLIRAMYEWIVDNQCTPHLLVEVKDAQTRVPQQYVDKGMIVLNVSPSAVRDLALGNEIISFSARFAGMPHNIAVPVTAVQAIYARENGQGIFLGEVDVAAEGAPPPTAGAPATPRDAGQQSPSGPFKGGKPPHLTVVK